MIKYGESVTRYVKLYQYETLDPATSSEWTPASGDVKVSKDGGTGANITTLPTYDSSMRLWKVSLSATEAQAKIVTIDFQDVTGDAINPVSLDIETFGNASAQYPSTFPVPVVSGDLPTNFADLAITSSTGLVSVGTLATDCVNAAALASDAVSEIQSGLATAANQATIEGKIDTIDGIVDTILVDTDAVQTAIAAGLTVDLNADQSGVTIGTVNSVLIPGTVATVANQTTIISALAVIDSLVDAILVDTGTTLPAELASLTVDLNADQSGVTIGGIAGTINTFDELDTALDAAHGAGSWLSGSGGGSLTGANSVTITITDGTDPLETVRVRVTKGAQTEVKTTDANGEVAFSLDNGTWEVRATLAGYTMAAQSLVVDGVETPTYAMTALSYDANPDPALVNGEYTVLINGVGTSGQSVYLELKEAPTTGDNATGLAAIDKRTLTSGDDGVTEVDNLIKGAKYGLRIGTAGRQWVFLVPADADDSEARVRINSFVGENT